MEGEDEKVGFGHRQEERGGRGNIYNGLRIDCRKDGHLIHGYELCLPGERRWLLEAKAMVSLRRNTLLAHVNSLPVEPWGHIKRKEVAKVPQPSRRERVKFTPASQIRDIRLWADAL